MGSERGRTAIGRGAGAAAIVVLVALTAGATRGRAQCVPGVFTVSPPPSAVNFGKTVVSIGDRDGDGYEEYVVADPDRSSGNGEVSFYDGRSNAWLKSTFGAAGERLGTALAVSGKRLLIGGPGYSGDRGRVRVYDIPSLTPGTTFIGSATGYRFGHALAGIEDVDGDAIPDFVVGIPGHGGGRGRVEVYRSRGGTWSRNGLFSSGSYGTSIAVGDVDDDGAPELIVGSPTLNVSTRPRSGRVSISEIASGLPRTSWVDGTNANEEFGTHVATLAQGDGADAWVATTRGPAVTGGGRADVHGPGGRLATLTGLGNHFFAVAIANAGDWDEDGYDELLIGSTATASIPPAAPAGEVRLVNGRTFSVHYQRRAARTFGASVAALHDAKPHGMPRVLAGAPDGTASGGAVQIVYPRVAPARDVVMLTEVTWAGSACVELTNFGSTPRDLTDWRVQWRNAVTTNTSSDINTTINPGESIVLRQFNGTCSVAPGTRTFTRLTVPPGFNGGAQVIGLFNSKRRVLNEVAIGSTTLRTFSGRIRGAVPTNAGPIGTIERFWGLDSNAGADWTLQRGSSLGLESRSSGQRGTDPLTICKVVINETADLPDLVELRAPQSAVDLQGWSLLVSEAQCRAQRPITPWSASTVVPGNAFYVVGEGAPPVEKPSGVGYVDILPLGFNIPWGTREYSCALYDGFGRLVDLMITSNEDACLRHNHPRAPQPVQSMVGTAPRNSADPSIGRDPISSDRDLGSDWFSLPVRTMGSANVPSTAAGHWQSLDVRLSHTGQDGGLALIVNGGPTAAGASWATFFSLTKCLGTGPKPVALCAPLHHSVGAPPLTGFFDADGSTRVDLPAGSVACALGLELVLYAYTSTGLRYTRVLDYTACGCP